ncbi:MAG: radical SAM family heme chaperone HemW [Bacillota bacterium]
MTKQDSLQKKIEARGLSLYFHFPFCKSKCNYCSFYSLTGCAHLKKQYITALVTELKLRQSLITTDIKPATIYFGGGTPSLFAPDDYATLISVIEKEYGIFSGAEITLEINPADIDNPDILQIYAGTGINRFSIGVQSFADQELEMLGRRHSAAQASRVLTYLAANDFNFSIDIISSLPGQTNQEHLQNIQKALEFKPSHLSIYNLQLEEGTRLYQDVEAGALPEPEEEVDELNYRRTERLLQDNGYKHYEISSYCLPGYRSRHNSLCWRLVPYLGFGPAAHSFYKLMRTANEPDLFKYIDILTENELPPARIIGLSHKDAQAEYMFLGLRLQAGIYKKDFKNLFSKSLATLYGPEIKGLVKEGYLKETPTQIKLTNKGKLLANYVLAEFI